MDVLLSQLVAGLSVGSVLLLVAVGLSLTFGQMGVINMAHGEFIMVGAYTAYVVQSILGDAGLSLLVSSRRHSSSVDCSVCSWNRC